MSKKVNIKVALEERGYFIDEKLELQLLAALATKPVAGAFLFGPAGAGKSQLPQVLAEIRSEALVFFQCFPGTREGDLLSKLIPDENTKSGIKIIDGPVARAAKMSQSQRVILVLDEWDKTRPSADSFMLDFLQSGRISLNGHEIQANFENLSVFITMNDEREISEPLLRRLPMITFRYPSTQLVRQALEQTHAGHQFLDAAVKLYSDSVKAGLLKPATIQELRQLLDALSQVENVDNRVWNILVRTFITKTYENHRRLVEFQREPDPEPEPDNYEDDNQYEQEDSYEDDDEYDTEPEEEVYQIPQIKLEAEIHADDVVEQNQNQKVEIPLEEAEKYYGIINLTEKSYDILARLALEDRELSDEPIENDWFKVEGNKILLKKKLHFIRDFQTIVELSNKIDDYKSSIYTYFEVEKEKVLEAIKASRRLKIVHASEKQFIFNGGYCKFRWKNGVLEAVIGLAQERFLRDFRAGEDSSEMKKDEKPTLFNAAFGKMIEEVEAEEERRKAEEEARKEAEAEAERVERMKVVDERWRIANNIKTEVEALLESEVSPLEKFKRLGYMLKVAVIAQSGELHGYEIKDSVIKRDLKALGVPGEYNIDAWKEKLELRKKLLKFVNAMELIHHAGLPDITVEFKDSNGYEHSIEVDQHSYLMISVRIDKSCSLLGWILDLEDTQDQIEKLKEAVEKSISAAESHIQWLLTGKKEGAENED